MVEANVKNVTRKFMLAILIAIPSIGVAASISTLRRKACRMNLQPQAGTGPMFFQAQKTRHSFFRRLSFERQDERQKNRFRKPLGWERGYCFGALT
jgi:hypothetical protein